MDTILLNFFNQTLASPFLDVFMLSLSHIALGLFAGLGVALVLGKERRLGLAILAALGAGLFMTVVFQFLALRPRPHDVRLIWPSPNFPSYPSGHATAAFGVAMVLGLHYHQIRWRLLFLLGAVLIGLSRVYLGHHYPSDIGGGFIVGSTVGAASYGLIVTSKPGQVQWQWLLWPQLALVLLATQMAYLNMLPYHLLKWPLADKVLHFYLFGSVVFWLNIWLKGRHIQVGRWSLPLAIVIPLSITTIEEGLQAFSPLRTADWTDLLSDILGMLFFLWLSEKVLAHLPPEEVEPPHTD